MAKAPLFKLSLIIRTSLSSINSKQNPFPVFTRRASHTFRTFSSYSNTNLIKTQNAEVSNQSEDNDRKKTQNVEISNQTEADDDVEKEELKTRINKFYEGDMDAIPSIFEAILKRKLTGKHEDSDNELVEELRQKYPGDISHEEFFSDSGSDSGSDSE
ncbi:uncharacterized protein LOC124942748 [Impatiens glandulifera]|uniref:uncharacterized protein LOC124942748 n=1 Tax=Impatiens glandulifera TaxID=253017 RepID=UPI001FB13C3A|nr:uncharacterized protein LOC124942748 [Impatiens glandulifera]